MRYGERGFVGIALIIVGAVLVYFLIGGFKTSRRYAFDIRDLPPITPADIEAAPCGLTITTPARNSRVASPVEVRGVAKGCGWERSGGRYGYVYVATEGGAPLSNPHALKPSPAEPSGAVRATVLFTVPPGFDEGMLVFQSEPDRKGRTETEELPVRFR